MKENGLQEQLQLLIEQTDGFYNRGEKTLMEKQEQFIAHRDELLAQIPEMTEVLADMNYSFYGAMAFIGKFQFADSPELQELRKETSEKKLKNLLGKNIIQVAQSARPAWDHLVANRPETLCVIVALCVMVEKNTNVQELLGKKKTVKGKKTATKTESIAS